MKWSQFPKLLRLKKKTGRLVVTTHYSPRVKLLISGVLVLALIVGGGVIYDRGLNMAGFESSLASRRLRELQDESKRFKDENAELRESLARAQRTLQMDQIAYQELERALNESARNIVKLREDLSFYKSILSPDSKITGLQIHSFNIERAAADNEYRYKLVLVQSLKHDQIVTGTCKLEISGTRDGAPAILHFPEGPGAPSRVNFKYFQDVEGVMKLPKNFKPQRIRASVVTGGASPQTVEQSYHWPQL